VTDFNPLSNAAPPAADPDAERRAQAVSTGATRAALGHPAGRAWLQARLLQEEARPSYLPGRCFDEVAWREGRKALLREIARELFPETAPNPEA
jgi:hypothetical protein